MSKLAPLVPPLGGAAATNDEKELGFMYRTKFPKFSRRGRLAALALALIAPAAGCNDDVGTQPLPDPGMPDAGMPPVEPAFTLQLLHAADGEASAAAVQDAPRFSAVVNALRSEMPDNTVLLSSGDNYIPGPFMSASDARTEASEDVWLRQILGGKGPGRADILMLNAIGFQASALGNHEFDMGPDVVSDLIRRAEVDDDMDGTPDRVYDGTSFPYLSCNLDFSASPELMDLVAPDGEEASDIPNSIACTTVITTEAGARIGVVGATTPTLPQISSPGADIMAYPADSTDLAALATIIQSKVDALTAMGIDKIILLAHMQQIALERQLATLLADVDIIVAGGSNTILADPTDRLRGGDTAADTYPILSMSAKDEPIAIVNTDGGYRYVGRLVVDFDEDGLIVPSTIDPDQSGAYATDDDGVTAVGNPAATAVVTTIADAVGAAFVAFDSNIFGKSTVYLEGQRARVRTEETNLGNLSADANLAFARTVDENVVISIKNGGGIRNPIGVVLYPAGSTDPADVQYLPPPANPLAGKEEGDISQFDIQNSLQFNNELALLTLTAAELEAVVEHGVAGVAPGATPGSFAQIAGLRFSFDPALEAGSRVRNLVVLGADGAIADVVVRDGAIEGDATRSFRVVTLSFLAGNCNVDGICGDGYPFGNLTAPDPVPLDMLPLPDEGITFAVPGTEQHALAWFIRETYPDVAPYMTPEVPVADDTRVQNLSERADTVLDQR